MTNLLILSNIPSVLINGDGLTFFCYPGLLRQQYYITADSNRLLKSAYVGAHVQRCPRLLHLLLIVMHWGRRRRLNGSSRNSFLSDENLATLFVTYCENSGFVFEVNLWKTSAFFAVVRKFFCFTLQAILLFRPSLTPLSRALFKHMLFTVMKQRKVEKVKRLGEFIARSAVSWLGAISQSLAA